MKTGICNKVRACFCFRKRPSMGTRSRSNRRSCTSGMCWDNAIDSVRFRLCVNAANVCRSMESPAIGKPDVQLDHIVARHRELDRRAIFTRSRSGRSRVRRNHARMVHLCLDRDTSIVQGRTVRSTKLDGKGIGADMGMGRSESRSDANGSIIQPRLSAMTTREPDQACCCNCDGLTPKIHQPSPAPSVSMSSCTPHVASHQSEETCGSTCRSPSG